MRILMIAPTPFFADRGCHIRIYEEVMGLEKLGHEVLVCTYGLGRDVEGVQIARTVNFPWYKKLSAGPTKTKILLLPCLCMTVLKNIRRFKPDVIHAHLHEGAVIARVCKVFYPGKAYIFDMQGGLVAEVLQHGFIKKGGLPFKFLKKLERNIVKWQHVITSSSHMIDDVIALGCKEDDCTNVKDGVDTDFFRPMEADVALAKRLGIDLIKPRILFMGLLETYQGIDMLIDAFSIVCKRVPEAQLILIGYPNIEHYKKICADKRLERNVIFTGAVNHLDLPKFLSLSQIAIAPKLSLTEGNIKVYYYMSMEMASVVFDCEINREVLGETGIYVKERTKEALAEKILWAFMHKNDCLYKGKEGRKIARDKLSNVAVARRIEKVYEEVSKNGL